MVADDFNRADENPIAGNWTITAGGVILVSNVILGTSALPNLAYWHANTFNAAHSSQAMVVLSTTGQVLGPAVCCQSGAGSGYAFAQVVNANLQRAYKCVAGTLTQLGSNYANTYAAGEILKLGVSGSTLTPYFNGSAQATRTDATLSGGAAGVYLYGTFGQLDDWVGTGEIVSGPAIPVFMNHFGRLRR